MLKKPFVKWMLVIPTLIFAILVSIYAYQFGDVFPSNATFNETKDLREVYGVIGDFFGGVLNPLLTFFGFGFLIYTIEQNSKVLDYSQQMLVQNEKILQISQEQLQRSTEELALNRQEIEGSKKALEMQVKMLEEQAKTQATQRFENTFFNLLKVYKDSVHQIQYIDFSQYINDLQSLNKSYRGTEALKKLIEKFEIEIEDVNPNNIKNVGEIFHQIFLNHDYYSINIMFNILLNIIHMIDSAHHINKKEFYITLLKSQMTAVETTLLIYYCVSDEQMKFKDYIRRYKLIDVYDIAQIPKKHRNFAVDLYK